MAPARDKRNGQDQASADSGGRRRARTHSWRYPYATAPNAFAVACMSGSVQTWAWGSRRASARSNSMRRSAVYSSILRGQKDGPRAEAAWRTRSCGSWPNGGVRRLALPRWWGHSSLPRSRTLTTPPPWSSDPADAPQTQVTVASADERFHLSVQQSRCSSRSVGSTPASKNGFAPAATFRLYSAPDLADRGCSDAVRQPRGICQRQVIRSLSGHAGRSGGGGTEPVEERAHPGRVFLLPVLRSGV
ncbi:hypothetical protein J2X34_002371 [Rhodococcus sp. BE178]